MSFIPLRWELFLSTTLAMEASKGYLVCVPIPHGGHWHSRVTFLVGSWNRALSTTDSWQWWSAVIVVIIQFWAPGAGAPLQQVELLFPSSLTEQTAHNQIRLPTSWTIELCEHLLTTTIFFFKIPFLFEARRLQRFISRPRLSFSRALNPKESK